MTRHYKDLRSYLEALKAIGELQEIDYPVDLDLEIGQFASKALQHG